MITTSANDNPYGMFAIPGVASSSDGENYTTTSFSERPIKYTLANSIPSQVNIYIVVFQ